MKTLPLFLGVIVCALSTATLTAKPPSTPARKPAPEPTPTVAPIAMAPETSADPLAHWLLQQNGGAGSLTLPLALVVHAATGKNILPIDPGNPADADVIARLGNVLDRLLPGMNKPESPAHVVTRTDEVTAFFEDAMRVFIPTVPGLSCPAPADGTAATPGSFPCLRVLDAASGKSFYLGVALYPTNGREAAVRALHFHPAEAAARFTDDGACLLVGIEYNGKMGKEIAFLNWELIDLAKLPVHVVTTFEATEADAHPPGAAVLNDGRKGRD